MTSLITDNANAQFVMPGQPFFPAEGYTFPPEFYTKWEPHVDDIINNNSTAIVDPLSVSWGSELGARYKTESFRLVAKVCGLGHICNASRLPPDEYMGTNFCSPCDHCRCDDVCVTYGDCCVDKLFDDVIGDVAIEDTPVLLEETSLSSCFDVRVRDHWQGNSLQKQRFITSCPPHYHQNNDVIKKCANGSSAFYESDAELRPDDLSNIWPVASRKTSASYRNMACAECHKDHNYEANDDDDDDMVFWNLQVSCQGQETSAPPDLTKLEALQYVLDQRCLLSFVAPEGVAERKCYKDHPMEPECNVEGRRTQMDVVLWKMCDTFPTMVRYRYSSPIYANLFCVFCQEERTSKWTPNCRTSHPFGFYFMISPSAIQQVVSQHQIETTCKCPENEALDPVSNTCRQLHCPQGFDLTRDENGEFQCTDDFTKALGLTYVLNIELTSVNSSLTYNDFITGDTFHNVSLQIKEELFNRLEPVQPKFYTDVPQFLVYTYSPSCKPGHGANNANDLTIELSAKFVLTREKKVSVIAHKFISFLNTEWILKVPQFNMKNETLVFVSKFQTPVIEPIPMLKLPVNTVHGFPLTRCREFALGVNLAEYSRTTGRIEYKEIKNTLTCPHFILDENLNDLFTVDSIEETIPMLRREQILRYNSTKSDDGDLNVSAIDFLTTISNGKETTIVCAEELLKYWKKLIIADEAAEKDSEDSVSFGKGLEFTSVICLAISCVCLFITLVTYLLFPSLRTLPGKNTTALVSNMLLTMILCLVTPFFEIRTVACQIVGVANHFFLLSSVMWMVICTYQMFRIFTRLFNHPHGHGSNSEESLRFSKYLSVSIFTPATIIAVNIICNNSLSSSSNSNNQNENEESNNNNSKTEKNRAVIIKPNSASCTKMEDSELTPIGYGDGVCYISNGRSVLLAAALPIIVAVLANCVFFCLTLRSMRQMTADQKRVRKEPRRQMVIYVKLCALTGLNWLPGLLSAFFDSEILWYIFLVLAGLQGLYVLIAFVCNARVLNLYKGKFCSNNKPKPTTTKSTTTKSGSSAKAPHTNESNLSHINDSCFYSHPSHGDNSHSTDSKPDDETAGRYWGINNSSKTEVDVGEKDEKNIFTVGRITHEKDRDKMDPEFTKL